MGPQSPTLRERGNGRHGRNASVHVRSSQPPGVRLDVFSDALHWCCGPGKRWRPAPVRAPFSLQFPATAGGFQVVMHGSCALIPPDGEPIRLGPGDVVFLRHGSRYVLCSDPAVRPERSATRGRTAVRISAGSPSTAPASRVVASGAYQLDLARAHPLLAGLPGVIHLPAPGQYPPLPVTVGQLAEEIHAPRPGSDSVVRALIDLMLLQIMRAWYDGLPEGEARAGRPPSPIRPSRPRCRRSTTSPPGPGPWTRCGGGRGCPVQLRPPVHRLGRRAAAQLPHQLANDECTRFLQDSDAPLATVAAGLATDRSSPSPRRSSAPTESPRAYTDAGPGGSGGTSNRHCTGRSGSRCGCRPRRSQGTVREKRI